jgi:uncharacterized iron-regulated membrane protein
MKKIFSWLHLWLSVPFGLIIAVICFSGAALVFEPEIMKLCHPTRYYAEKVKGKPLPLELLVASVNRQLPDTMPIANVQIPASPTENYRMGFPGRGVPPLYVDPYTGDIRDRSAGQSRFFSVMRRLHRWLLDDFKYGEGASTGKIVVGVSTLMFVLIIIAGVVIWIPKSRKGLRANLSVKLRFGWKRLWRDLHVTLGIYAALILLALALTGLTWSFSWYRNGFYRVFGAEPPQMAIHGNAPSPQPQPQQGREENEAGRRESGRGERGNSGRSENGYQGRGERGNSGRGENGYQGRGERGNSGRSENGYQGRGERQDGENRRGERNGENPAGNRRNNSSSIDYSQWQAVLDQLKERQPDFKSLTIQDGQALISLSSVGNARATDSYTFNAQTGDITGANLYKDADRTRKLRGWIYSVHVGSWGGMLTRILTFMAALFGATLPLTGYYLWISRYMQRGKKERFNR